MNGPAISGRVFLVGVPRSGTTLLQALLAAHPAMTSFTESHFFARHYTHLPLLGDVLIRDPSARVRRFLAENGAEEAFAAPGLPMGARFSLTRPLFGPAVAKRLVRLLDDLARARGARWWLEKTPRHLHRLALIEGACDDGVPTHFVHLVRDGLQTVASLRTASRSWERAYTLDECIQRWNEDLAITLEHLDAPRHHVIRYEALTADPAAVLRPLLAALGLPWAPEMLERYAPAAGTLVAQDESWKQDVGRSIRPSGTADKVFDAAQRAYVSGALRQERYARIAAAALEERVGD